MSENGRKIMVALPWAVIATAGAGLVAWGDARSRLSAVEGRTEQIAAEQRELQRQDATQDTQIAVIRSQLDTIIGQQAAIISKLERMERRQ